MFFALVLISLPINIIEIIFIFIFIDDVNYPCKRYKNNSTQSNSYYDSSGYYYVYYYYYRRLTPKYNCEELHQDFYIGIVRKAESIFTYITVFFTIFVNIIISLYWYKMFKDHYGYDYEPCDCSCYCCFKKFKDKKKVDIKVYIQNTDTNNIKAVPDIEIHPTEAKSKEPIQEKIVK